MEHPPVTEILIAIYILWDVAKKFFSEKNTDLKKNTEATMTNTVAIIRLEDNLETLLSLPDEVKEIETRLRVLDERLKNHMDHPISG